MARSGIGIVAAGVFKSCVEKIRSVGSLTAGPGPNDCDTSTSFADDLTTTIAGVATIAIFALVQWLGSKLQAQFMEWMTYGAIFALVWFWIACIPGVRLERILTAYAGANAAFLQDDERLLIDDPPTRPAGRSSGKWSPTPPPPLPPG